MDDGRVKLVLCGQKLIRDRRLGGLLGSKYDVICIRNLRKIIYKLAQQQVKLIIFEYSRAGKRQLKLLKKLKTEIPDMIVIVVDGGENVKKNVELLVSGASDVFPTPYDCHLLAERVDALLK